MFWYYGVYYVIILFQARPTSGSRTISSAKSPFSARVGRSNDNQTHWKPGSLPFDGAYGGCPCPGRKRLWWDDDVIECKGLLGRCGVMRWRNNQNAGLKIGMNINSSIGIKTFFKHWQVIKSSNLEVVILWGLVYLSLNPNLAENSQTVKRWCALKSASAWWHRRWARGLHAWLNKLQI